MTNTAPSPHTSHKRFFFDKLGITERLLEQCLGQALSAGGDYADLYFESVTATSLGVDEQIVKSASQGTSAGCGIRVISGERTGYAYTDNLSPERLLHAARTAALIASGPAKQPIQGFTETRGADLYPVPLGGFDLDLATRLELILRADRAARAYDPRIVQVRAGYSEELKRILIAGSDGAFASDTQPLCRLNVFVIAKDAAITTKGCAGAGGRSGLDQFTGSKSPEHLAREAARGAILQLGALPAPAGEMQVVLGPGWPGILLHEAVGHGLEADFNRKKTSAFAGLIGQSVASSKVTVVDNGTMAGRRGSLNVDDEGSATQETTLIENGILKGYLTDKLSARLTGAANTGSGRRESYQSIPMPRMTNTYMLAGDDSPGRHPPLRQARPLRRQLRRRLRSTSPTANSSSPRRSLPHRRRQNHRPRPRRHPDRQRPRSPQIRLHGRPRSKAGRRHRHLRQRRPVRPRRRRHAHHQARQNDRRRHRKVDFRAKVEAVMLATEFLKTIYVGDRGLKSIMIDASQSRVVIQVDEISRIRSKSGSWEYYNDENIVEGLLVFTDVRTIVFDPAGPIPNDYINDLEAVLLPDDNYRFMLSVGSVHVSFETTEVVVTIVAKGVHLEDPANPGVAIES